jgi:hypothetical protein
LLTHIQYFYRNELRVFFSECVKISAKP